MPLCLTPLRAVRVRSDAEERPFYTNLRKSSRKTKSNPPSYHILIFLCNLFLEFSHIPAQSGWRSGREPGRLPVSRQLPSVVLWAACVCTCHDPRLPAQVLSPRVDSVWTWVKSSLCWPGGYWLLKAGVAARSGCSSGIIGHWTWLAGWTPAGAQG